MPFYVPLGLRGVCFQVGTFLITVFGGLVYWRASRRRSLVALPLTLSFDLPDLGPIPFSE